MGLAKITSNYFAWHYTSAYRQILVIWENFLLFFYNLFSIPLLLKTFFSPYKRMDEGYPSMLNLEAFLTTLVVNTLMRVVGVVARTVVLIIGAIFLMLTLISGIVFYILWSVLPALLCAGFLMGILLIIL